MKKIRLAVVGLGFGRAFLPAYLRHPDVEEVIACDSDPRRLDSAIAEFGIARRYSDLKQVLNAGDIDAVHLLTPVNWHAAPAVAVLEAGKHCACAVTMGNSLEEIRAVLDARRRTGRNYMMMETVVYSREFSFVKALYESGDLGRLQFARGAHYQDLENYPDCWRGSPPMHYVTHALGPILALTGARVKSVTCLGSGFMREEYRERYGNPYPIETALFQLDGMPVAAEITRTLFETAVEYKETFDIYGENLTFLWRQFWDAPHSLIRLHPAVPGEMGRRSERTTPDIPSYAAGLPDALAAYATDGHRETIARLVHEFIRSSVDDRPSAIDAVTAANWCAPGICAHESAMRGGVPVEVPRFD